MSQFLRVDFFVAALCLLVSQAGCAQVMNRELSPPAEGEKISIIFKVSKNLVADTMRVMYRSEKCSASRLDVNEEPFRVEGYRAIEVTPKQSGNSGFYVANLDKDGGGACRWKISNVTFGVRYQTSERLGVDAESVSGGGVIVVFDENAPQEVSMYGMKDVSKDLIIKKNYYPWISESFLVRREKMIRPFTDGDLFVAYRARYASKIFFEAVSHDKFFVKSVGPKVKEDGNYTKFIYTDGSVVASGSSRPDFKKLEAIRLGQ
ncbi:hypothetical protein [Pseudomonas tohonis]|uniref:hypothetical protein n=1 Tax=Pseudomonas tohonis TaxID=2725477 RepID=UPI001F44F2E4|nr:hypothetical protein [Pseudomonas tohonis]